jgi:general secretion pathway protein B
VDDAFAAAPVVEEAAEQTSLVPEPRPAPASSPPTPRILPGDDLPTIEQLIGSGALNIPMLNLDLHVYSAKPSGRFVVINSRKYKEGGQLTEGPTVERITGDGVVLTNQGRRFTLSRK